MAAKPSGLIPAVFCPRYIGKVVGALEGVRKYFRLSTIHPFDDKIPAFT
jgi:hypothetical protein